MSLPDVIFFQGQFIPGDQAKVSVLTHGFNYGTGCFEGIRGYWNDEHQDLYLLQMREHYERLHQSARILSMKLPYSVDELIQLTIDLVRRNGFRQDVYIRPLLYKSTEQIGVRLHNLDDDLTIFAVPFGHYYNIDRPLRACFSTWRRVDDNSIPARAKITGAYINSALAKSEAYMAGFDDAIMLDSSGHVSEFSAANLFIVRNGQLITPPVTDNILEGITRRSILDMAREELGISTIERSIDRTELYVAEEVLLCGTGAQVVAVGEIQHQLVGDGQAGPIARQLSQIYYDAVKGNLPRYRHWCQPVYQSTALPSAVPMASATE